MIFKKWQIEEVKMHSFLMLIKPILMTYLKKSKFQLEFINKQTLLALQVKKNHIYKTRTNVYRVINLEKILCCYV